MDEILRRIWEDMLARTTGPMWFRLILQPLVGIGFGVRAGLRNAGLSVAANRGALWRQAVADVGKVAAIGLVLDLIVQWLVLGRLYPGEAVLVVLLIVIVPYQVVRTLVAWLARRRPTSTEP